MLEVRLLGQFAVRTDAKPVEIASRPAQSLLAYLILRPGIEHRREKLAGLLWPDAVEANARRNLRQALWQLRQAIGGGRDYLLTDDISIAFDVHADYWLDAAILERKAAEGQSWEDLIGVVSIYGGDLLPGFYDEWVVLERERLQAVFESKMALLLDRLVEARRWPDALEWGERWIALGHVPEPAYRALMVAHANLGNLSSMAAVHQRCVEALRKELGVEPSEQTRVLYERLSKGEKLPGAPTEAAIPSRYRLDSEIGQGGAGILPPLPPSAETRRFVQGSLAGREREIAEVMALWQRACSGEGRVLLVSGDTGMGKTCLVGELAEAASSAGATILPGECYAEGGAPFAPFADVLREWLGRPADPDMGRGRLGAGAADLLDLVPEFRPAAPGAPPAPPLTPDAQRSRLFDAYTFFLDGLAAERPTLLIVDDLHWADESSLDLLLYLARRLTRRRVLIAATCRMDEPHPALSKTLAALVRARLIHEVPLAPLDAAAMAALARSRLGLSADPPADFLEALCARTEGNPFFAEELLKALGGAGPPAGWSRATLEAVNVPRSIRESIGWQIDELSEPAQAVAARAAVIGRHFDFDFLRALAGLDEDALLAALRALVQAHLVAERVSGANVVCTFRHPLVHETIYQRLLAAERRKWHAVAGAELERRIGFDESRLSTTRATSPHHRWAPRQSGGIPAEVDQLARHFMLAGDWLKAFHFARLAADRNFAIFAYQTALRWSSEALALITDGRVTPPPAVLIDAYGMRCACHWLLDDYPAGVADGQTALRLAREQGDWEREVAALYWLSHIRLDQGLYEETIRLAQEALAIAEAHAQRFEAADLLLNLGKAHLSGIRDLPGGGMDITVSREQGRLPITVFHVKGVLNAASYEQLQAQARQAFETGARDLLIDLAEVSYMSSAGIRALVDIFKLLRADSPAASGRDEAIGKGLRDGTLKTPHLKLLNPSPHVLEVLSMAGVDRFLEIHHNLEDAVVSF